MDKRSFWHWGSLLSICITLLLNSEPLESQNSRRVIISKTTLSTVSIIDRNLISYILDQCLIPETSVDMLEIFDINENGFGENDVIKVVPSNKMYFIERVSEDVQNLMDNWEFQANFQITGRNEPPSVYDSLKTDKAATSIFSTLLRGINRNYHDWPIKIKLERDSVGVTFEMWGYNEYKLETGNPEPFMPDSVVSYDVLHVFHDDTLINVDTKLYDFLYIYSETVDTVFVGKRPELDNAYIPTKKQ
ncbi:hypothetical protein JXJ21_18290 [candidate division KSB1 bacterium]|nr:hypothetical protein [candidate division KSB1 bacterium]